MNTNEPQSDSHPHIFVDDDWKTQVEREKERLRQEQQARSNQTGNPTDTASEVEDQDDDVPPLPPASLEGLFSMLASQAMGAMGVFPDPVTGKPNPNRRYSKFLIDTLSVLEEKTQGNRTEEESNQLRDALHHLRMIYIASPAHPEAMLYDDESDDDLSEPQSPIIQLP